MLAPLALALVVSAPSFDCTKAATNVEKMVCSDPELAALDRAVARLYVGVARRDRVGLQNGGRIGGLFDSQSDWLKQRDNCADRACLIAAHDERLFDLFLASQTPTRQYVSKAANGTMAILPLGDGWYAFYVNALWIGPVEGAVNEDAVYGHFRLAGNRAEKAPVAAERECGWRIERLSRDRWWFEELYSDDGARAVGWGGMNARATGIYSPLGRQRKPK